MLLKNEELTEADRPMIDFIKNQGKSDLIGLEIGILYGINTEHILQTLNIQKIYLIDPYENCPEYLDLKGPIFIVAKQIAEKRLAPYINKIAWIIKKSSDAVNDIPDNLDFVYIDGNHSYEFVLQDIKNYFPKVKKGGVIGGHDYYNMNKAREVKKAVDEFISENKLKLYVANIDWWIVK